MNTIKDLLIFKGKKNIFSVSPHDSVASALSTMSENNLDAILVMDGNEIVGLFSEKDSARKLLLNGKSSTLTPIHEVMERAVIYVTPDYLLDECLALMTKKHIRHLPVIDKNGETLALISIEDVVEAVLEGKEFMISELTRYITGSPIINYGKQKYESIYEPVLVKPKSYGDKTATA